MGYDVDLRVHTAEHVGLTYTLAGIGNRFLAAFLDLVCLTLIFAGLGLTAAVAAPAAQRLGETWAAALAGAYVIFTLLIVPFVYYVVLEAVWNGQSLGKRIVGIRVMRDDGTPVGFFAVAVRNLVRIIDLLPPVLAMDVLVLLLSRKGQRLGDVMAGTIVVKAGGERDFERLRTRVSGVASPVTTRALSGEAQRVVREFVMREAGLTSAARGRVAQSIAGPLRPLVPESAQHPDDVEFLHAVAASLRAQAERASGRQT